MRDVLNAVIVAITGQRLDECDMKHCYSTTMIKGASQNERSTHGKDANKNPVDHHDEKRIVSFAAKRVTIPQPTHPKSSGTDWTLPQPRRLRHSVSETAIPPVRSTSPFPPSSSSFSSRNVPPLFPFYTRPRTYSPQLRYYARHNFPRPQLSRFPLLPPGPTVADARARFMLHNHRRGQVWLPR